MLEEQMRAWQPIIEDFSSYLTSRKPKVEMDFDPRQLSLAIIPDHSFGYSIHTPRADNAALLRYDGHEAAIMTVSDRVNRNEWRITQLQLGRDPSEQIQSMTRMLINRHVRWQVLFGDLLLSYASRAQETTKEIVVPHKSAISDLNNAKTASAWNNYVRFAKHLGLEAESDDGPFAASIQSLLQSHSDAIANLLQSSASS